MDMLNYSGLLAPMSRREEQRYKQLMSDPRVLKQLPKAFPPPPPVAFASAPSDWSVTVTAFGADPLCFRMVGKPCIGLPPSIRKALLGERVKKPAKAEATKGKGGP